jgi:hypothetical protein
MKKLLFSVTVLAVLTVMFSCKGAGNKDQQASTLADSISTEVNADEQDEQDAQDDYDQPSSSIDAQKIIGTWKTKSTVLGAESADITINFEEEDVTLNMNVRKSIGGIGSCSTTVSVPGTYSLNANQEIEWEFYLEEAEMGKLNASFTEDAKDEIYFTPGTEGKYRGRMRNKVMEEVTKIVNTCRDLSPLPLRRITARKLIFDLDGREFIFSRVEE